MQVLDRPNDPEKDKLIASLMLKRKLSCIWIKEEVHTGTTILYGDQDDSTLVVVIWWSFLSF